MVEAELSQAWGCAIKASQPRQLFEAVGDICINFANCHVDDRASEPIIIIILAAIGESIA
jgi:hypothetical protein